MKWDNFAVAASAAVTAVGLLCMLPATGATEDASASGWLLIGAAAFAALALRFARRTLQAKHTAPADGDWPLPKLVWLLKQPAPLTRKTLAAACRRAWSSRAQVKEIGPGFFEICHAGRKIQVAALPRPFYDLNDPRASCLRDAVIDAHRACIAIGEVKDDSLLTTHLAQLAAELQPPGSLALLSVQANVYVKNTHAVLDALRSQRPEALFTERGDVPPSAVENIVSADRKDPKLQQAVAQARTTLHLFRERWSRKARREIFVVKAPFGTEREHMWVEVRLLEADSVEGQLANEPRHCPGLHARDTVTVPLSDLSDWMITVDGEITDGGYTLDVLMRQGG